MNKEDIWRLFKSTGNINYYLKYKDMIQKGIGNIGDNKSKWNNNK